VVLVTSPFWTSSVHIRGLWWWPYGPRWSEPLDLPLLLSQTNFIRSLASVDADVDSATYDLVAQCGAGGGKPKLDHMMTHTRLS